MTLRNIAAIVLSAAAIASQAKDLKTEITVDRTIVPVEREATRLGSLTPQLLSSPVSMRRLSLADYTNPAEITRSASTLEPAAYGETFALSPYKGYAAIGYFPTFNIGASAGYKFIDNSRTRLGAWLQYDGFSYKPTAESAQEGSYSNNTVSVGAAFDQRVGSKSSLGVHAAYTFADLRLPDGMLDNRQNVNAFDADLSWWSRAGLVGYHAKAAFSHFGYGKDINEIMEAVSSTQALYDRAPEYKPASENRFNFNAGVGFFGSSVAPRGGIEVSADFISRSNGLEYLPKETRPDYFVNFVSPLSAGTLGIVSVTPYYAFNSGRVHGRIGAKTDLSVGGEGKKFHIAPAVMLDWNVASQFAIYARINGGEQLNSLRSLYDYCPFVGGLWHYQRSHIPVAADLGFNIGSFKGFSARLFGGYAIANDWLMPQMAVMNYLSGSTVPVTNYGSYDLKGWHAGIGFSYDWRSVVKADVSAETASNGDTDAYYLWRDRAKYVINASVEAKPIKALEIGVGYQLRTDRHNYINLKDETFRPYSLGSVSDLSVSASYAITDAFTVFARGENLLNKRYNLVTDIEAQGIKGLIGISYKF